MKTKRKRARQRKHAGGGSRADRELLMAIASVFGILAAVALATWIWMRIR